jgi:hypothetical protein
MLPQPTIWVPQVRRFQALLEERECPSRYAWHIARTVDLTWVSGAASAAASWFALSHQNRRLALAPNPRERPQEVFGGFSQTARSMESVHASVFGKYGNHRRSYRRWRWGGFPPGGRCIPKTVQVGLVGGEIGEVTAADHAQRSHGLAERPGWRDDRLARAAFKDGKDAFHRVPFFGGGVRDAVERVLTKVCCFRASPSFHPL